MTLKKGGEYAPVNHYDITHLEVILKECFYFDELPSIWHISLKIMFAVTCFKILDLKQINELVNKSNFLPSLSK